MTIGDFIRCRISNIKEWYFHHLVYSALHPIGVVMNIGCGNAPTPDWIPHTILYRVDPMLSPVIEGFDIKGTWVDAIEYMKTNHVDYVVLLDVVEHLEKDEAMFLLYIMQVYVRKIVVFTPNGFVRQDDGMWNTHRSGWTTRDFTEGWNTKVIKKYHVVDFRGNVLEDPVDAIVAVWSRENCRNSLISLLHIYSNEQRQ